MYNKRNVNPFHYQECEKPQWPEPRIDIWIWSYYVHMNVSDYDGTNFLEMVPN